VNDFREAPARTQPSALETMAPTSGVTLRQVGRQVSKGCFDAAHLQHHKHAVSQNRDKCILAYVHCSAVDIRAPCSAAAQELSAGSRIPL
jgi:hypothetical protein